MDLAINRSMRSLPFFKEILPSRFSDYKIIAVALIVFGILAALFIYKFCCCKNISPSKSTTDSSDKGSIDETPTYPKPKENWAEKIQDVLDGDEDEISQQYAIENSLKDRFFNPTPTPTPPPSPAPNTPLTPSAHAFKKIAVTSPIPQKPKGS